MINVTDLNVDFAVDSMNWSGLGLVVGYLIGRTEETLRAIWKEHHRGER